MIRVIIIIIIIVEIYLNPVVTWFEALCFELVRWFDLRCKIFGQCMGSVPTQHCEEFG